MIAALAYLLVVVVVCLLVIVAAGRPTARFDDRCRCHDARDGNPK